MSIYFSDVEDALYTALSRLRNINHHYTEAERMEILLRKLLNANYEQVDSYSDYEWKSETKIGKFSETSKWGSKIYNIAVYEYDGEIDEISFYAIESIMYLAGYPNNKEDYSAKGTLYFNGEGELVKFGISDDHVNLTI